MLSSRSRQVREKNFTRSIDWGGGRVVSTLNNVHGQDKFKLLDRSMLRHVWCSLAGGVCVCGCVGVGGGGGGTRYNGLYGEAPPERGTFFL